MTRRDWFRTSLVAAGGAALLPRQPLQARGAEATPNPGRRPNILLILVDDLGNRSLSCCGGTVATPNLDRLARDGMVFRNAHACPMCAPTRDEMMTGLSRAGRGRPGADVPFFTNHLQRLGYATGMAGKWFVGRVFDPPMRGFDEACILVNGYRHWAPDVMVWGSGGMLKELNQPKVEGRLNEWEILLEGDARHKATRLAKRYGEDVVVDFLCDFIERRGEGGRSTDPFFAYYSSKLTHVPHAPTPDGDAGAIEAFRAAFADIRDRNLQGLDRKAQKIAARRSLRLGPSRGYRNDGIRYLDKMVGRLMAKLVELGLRKDTLVLFTSDNGNSALDPLPEGADRLPGRKGDSREGGTRVPLIACWPRVIKPGSACDDLVHVQDFLATFLELAGGKPSSARACDGRSFAPQLRGQKGERREYFIGCGAHPSIWLKRVATELGQPDLKATRLAWVRGLRYKLYNDGRFYDLQDDLAEARRILPGKGTAEAEAARARFQTILDESLGR
jgi:arylsulfatase A